MLRIPLTVLAISILAAPVLAQMAGAPAPSPLPAAGIPNTATPTGAAAAAASSNPSTQKPMDDIGYDAKVKRDPYGNIIGDKPQTTAPKTESEKLRNDSRGSLRSDRDMMSRRATNPAVPKPTSAAATKEVPAQDATGHPIITPAGAPVTATVPNK